jgi:hypothetical protein
MSAFVVSKQDIDILVTAYLALHEPSARIEPAKIGRILWLENVASVAYRYNMPARHCEEHAAYKRAVRDYAYEPIHAKALAVAKIARCYAYQSCEHDGWEASRAKRICDLLEATFPDVAGPAYDALPWGVSSEADLKAVRV